ncbi:hypothetical protein [Arthrobacter sp. zg-Y1110]|uniref:hypothetical protein n=1 Tax=Arthrobacter sp. zg-Y1110 TaxID=2886932 RepID=UPI001D13E16A|nr:hypothetical protein [Arthrobacter sp. zg-Y1110]MCC3292968.1 hypothetical protein [Arthrobacter sp. zg-Y1110]UWX86907.1 hypothetical protein N2K99_18865 [Arthrobacter sp. zg-Y1110]
MSTPNPSAMYRCTATYSSTETVDGLPVVTRGILTLTLPLREATIEEAPVAALVPSGDNLDAVPGSRLAEIRVLDGVFFRQPRTPSGGGIPPWSDWADVLIGRHIDGTHGSEDEARGAILDATSGLILINGEMWVRIHEPFLYVTRHGYRVDVVTTGPTGEEPQRRFALTEARHALAAARAESLRDGVIPIPELDVRILIPGLFSVDNRPERIAEAQANTVAKAWEAVAELMKANPTVPTPADIRTAVETLEKAAEELAALTFPRN